MALRYREAEVKPASCARDEKEPSGANSIGLALRHPKQAAAHPATDVRWPIKERTRCSPIWNVDPLRRLRRITNASTSTRGVPQGSMRGHSDRPYLLRAPHGAEVPPIIERSLRATSG